MSCCELLIATDRSGLDFFLGRGREGSFSIIHHHTITGRQVLERQMPREGCLQPPRHAHPDRGQSGHHFITITRSSGTGSPLPSPNEMFCRPVSSVTSIGAVVRESEGKTCPSLFVLHGGEGGRNGTSPLLPVTPWRNAHCSGMECWREEMRRIVNFLPVKAAHTVSYHWLTRHGCLEGCREW